MLVEGRSGLCIKDLASTQKINNNSLHDVYKARRVISQF